ncbi:MAG: pilus assembly protein N-terminal domain-containing protein [Bryobacterales bacterium]|nr:pilus assembly protein N-terminal domain-containing protein [Bryobacteraceae bacterium]MDW8129933.1 pilus assembly protein N-terminal domain-containing protein [Bryobacterales bacterium]
MKPRKQSLLLVLTWVLLIGAFLPLRTPLVAQPAPGARDLFLTAGKSLVVESPVVIQRVSVANPKVAEAVVINPREVLINGLEPGETSLIIWQQGGNRLLFDLKVRPSMARLEVVRQELEKELPGQDVSITLEGENVFLRGTVNDRTAAERAAEIAGTLGKVVNLLYVKTPPAEQQILLKVRFANVDRGAAQDLGANFMSLGALNTPAAVTTQQYQPPQVQFAGPQGTSFNLTDALNIFLFRPDLDLAATIRALQSKRLLEILAEPNLLAMNGQQASFLAGGEFPIPVVQSGIAGAGAVTIQWREFGVRINFLPTITPRGTIRLRVAPEVSSLDYANALTFQGFTIPAISTRRVQTEIELESGQSFLIAGLLDNRVIESFSKIPGIGDIPVIGKLFQSRSLSKSNTELLVAVTPELVRPIPKGQPVPDIAMPREFMKDAPRVAPRTPGMEVTGEVPVKPLQERIPVEQLAGPRAAPAAAPAVQVVPVPSPERPRTEPAPSP